MLPLIIKILRYLSILILELKSVQIRVFSIYCEKNKIKQNNI